MNKRAKLKLRNMKLFFIKYIFNGKYIVRNLMIATIFMAVVVVVMGVAIVSGKKDDESAKPNNNDSQAVIYVEAVDNLNSTSIMALSSNLENDNQPDVIPNSSEMVADAPSEFDNKFVVIAEGVNVRAEATTESDIVGSLTYGNVGDIISSDGEWIYFTSGEVTGYVKAEFVVTRKEAEKYVTPGSEYTTAIPVVQVEEKETTTEEAEETTEEVFEETTEEVVEEEPEEVFEEESDDNSDPTSRDNYVAVETTARGAISLTEEEINLVASIVTLECGYEPYEGQLAVANVILNRLQSGRWGSTVADVIYAPGQFSTASSSSLQYYLENGAKASCVQAVQEAVAGTNNIGAYMSFRPTYAASYDSYTTFTIIGNHVFFN